MNAISPSATMVDSPHSHVYEAAASLFDNNTTLDLTDEYHRGVAETVMRIIGLDSDCKEEVAEVISEFTINIDHKDIARRWIRHHGMNIYVGMDADIQDKSEVPLSESDIAIIRRLIETATIEIQLND